MDERRCCCFVSGNKVEAPTRIVFDHWPLNCILPPFFIVGLLLQPSDPRPSSANCSSLRCDRAMSGEISCLVRTSCSKVRLWWHPHSAAYPLRYIWMLRHRYSPMRLQAHSTARQYYHTAILLHHAAVLPHCNAAASRCHSTTPPLLCFHGSTVPQCHGTPSRYRITTRPLCYAAMLPPHHFIDLLHDHNTTGYYRAAITTPHCHTPTLPCCSLAPYHTANLSHTQSATQSCLHSIILRPDCTALLQGSAAVPGHQTTTFLPWHAPTLALLALCHTAVFPLQHFTVRLHDHSTGHYHTARPSDHTTLHRGTLP